MEFNIYDMKRFVYPIPKELKPEEAAPLMCAGLTVFTAFYQADLRPTAHVAVVGIGGLGHLALQFARAMGYHVTAISHTEVKKVLFFYIQYELL